MNEDGPIVLEAPSPLSAGIIEKASTSKVPSAVRTQKPTPQETALQRTVVRTTVTSGQETHHKPTKSYSTDDARPSQSVSPAQIGEKGKKEEEEKARGKSKKQDREKKHRVHFSIEGCGPLNKQRCINQELMEDCTRVWYSSTRNIESLASTLSENGHTVSAMFLMHFGGMVTRILLMDGSMNYSANEFAQADDIIRFVSTSFMNVLYNTMISSCDDSGPQTHFITLDDEAMKRKTKISEHKNNGKILYINLHYTTEAHVRAFEEALADNTLATHVLARQFARELYRLQQDKKIYLRELVFYICAHILDVCEILHKKYSAENIDIDASLNSCFISQHLCCSTERFFDWLATESRLDVAIKLEAKNYSTHARSRDDRLMKLERASQEHLEKISKAHSEVQKASSVADRELASAMKDIEQREQRTRAMLENRARALNNTSKEEDTIQKKEENSAVGDEGSEEEKSKNGCLLM